MKNHKEEMDRLVEALARAADVMIHRGMMYEYSLIYDIIKEYGYEDKRKNNI